jgi:peroxiredoxin Q/BCP
MRLKVGDPAPMFTATITNGNQIRLSDYLGIRLILYFYPMDDTPGCTRQACSLRDSSIEIHDKGAAILGVSTQDISSHQRFTEKYNINFPLIADVNADLARAYGAVGESSLLGSCDCTKIPLVVAKRITFIIDESGHIAQIIDKPDCANHATEIIRML